MKSDVETRPEDATIFELTGNPAAANGGYCNTYLCREGWHEDWQRDSLLDFIDHA